MLKDIVNIEGIDIQVYSFNTLVVGSGAASLNAVKCLKDCGVDNVALITEGINCGTSRNTGSDKQTYYKISTASDECDSVYKMAETLFKGGSMHGDIALVEAAGSLKAFFDLVSIGVPFPYDCYGQFVGYQTDHDECKRATSAGPLTSKYMTEKLEYRIRESGTTIFDRFQVISILVDKKNNETVGLLAIDLDNIDEISYGLTLFRCNHIVYGTGGPAGVYYNSVYPISQFGATGIALEAGVKAGNLTEWQYGIASKKHRWNVSGTYQQVIPRYISTDRDLNDEKEFICDYLDIEDELYAVFLKGYQWPFDPNKLGGDSISSYIDIIVYIETQIKGRRVFIDFMHNPSRADIEGRLDYSKLNTEAYEYLNHSNALLDTPIKRLKEMNYPAIKLYLDNGIDICKEYLEVDVCSQHNNGGLIGDINYESNIKNFYPVGEVNGSLGVYRPGGSALNATQVGSYRAANNIYFNNTHKSDNNNTGITGFTEIIYSLVADRIKLIRKILNNSSYTIDIDKLMIKLQMSMSKNAAFVRDKYQIERLYEDISKEFKQLVSTVGIDSIKDLSKVFRVYDMLIVQMAIASSMLEYIEQGGTSRGSYLIINNEDGVPINDFETLTNNKIKKCNRLMDSICETKVKINEGGIDIINNWVKVRPIPNNDTWFEKVWQEFRAKQ